MNNLPQSISLYLFALILKNLHYLNILILLQVFEKNEDTGKMPLVCTVALFDHLEHILRINFEKLEPKLYRTNQLQCLF